MSKTTLRALASLILVALLLLLLAAAFGWAH